MAAHYYPAIIERGQQGYGVTFPDLPGCTSGGDSVDEAARSAEEALALHIRGMLDDGEALPDPSPVDTCPRDPDVEEVARLLVCVELPGRAVRFNATMDEGFLANAARRVLGTD